MTEPTPEPNERDTRALRATVLAAVAKDIYRRLADEKARLAELMTIGDTAHPAVPDGSPRPPVAGTITYKHGPSQIVVTDPDDLMAWVAETYPMEIEVIERIRPAFMKRFVDANGTLVGPGGELDVPGIEVREGAPVIAVTVDKTNAAALLDAVRMTTLRELTNDD